MIQKHKDANNKKKQSKIIPRCPFHELVELQKHEARTIGKVMGKQALNRLPVGIRVWYVASRNWSPVGVILVLSMKITIAYSFCVTMPLQGMHPINILAYTQNIIGARLFICIICNSKRLEITLNCHYQETLTRDYYKAFLKTKFSLY